ncbi:MAG: hypothetical protein LQ340_007933, partial [Diploschistes diacapsis]
MITDVKKPLHVAIGNLILKAWDIDGEANATLGRRHSSTTPGQSPSTPSSMGQNQNHSQAPYFISILRAQRANKHKPHISSPGSVVTPTRPLASAFDNLATSTNLDSATPFQQPINSFDPRPYPPGSSPSSSSSSSSATLIPHPVAASTPKDSSSIAGMGSGAFFPFLPPPPSFQRHLRGRPNSSLNQSQSQ